MYKKFKIKAIQNVTFNLNHLITNFTEINLNGYYRYSGSLTTPPCSENVIWTIFEQKIDISASQVETIIL